jgi:membrane protein required for colicin V production
MNGFDIMLVVVLVAFTVIGALRGLVREVITLITWVVAVAVAWLFAADIASWFDRLFDEPVAQKVTAFIALFAFVWLLGTIAGILVTRLFAKGGLRWVNRIGGGLIGLARGAVIVVAVFLAAGVTSAPKQAWWRESLLAPPLERAALQAVRWLPADIARHIRYG